MLGAGGSLDRFRIHHSAHLSLSFPPFLLSHFPLTIVKRARDSLETLRVEGEKEGEGRRRKVGGRLIESKKQ